MINIGVIGRYCSGKDTIAEYLVRKYNYKRIALADPIRQIMKDFFGIENKSDPRNRKYAQIIGTNFRSLDKEVWINYLLKKVKQVDKPVVVSDVRFVNEAEKFLECNDLGETKWELIYLNCPDEVRIERAKARDGYFNPETLNHVSEMEVEKIYELYKDRLYVIDSSKSIEENYRDVDLFTENKLTQIQYQLPF